jgi:hypothetical protein
MKKKGNTQVGINIIGEFKQIKINKLCYVGK